MKYNITNYKQDGINFVKISTIVNLNNKDIELFNTYSEDMFNKFGIIDFTQSVNQYMEGMAC